MKAVGRCAPLRTRHGTTSVVLSIPQYRKCQAVECLLIISEHSEHLRRRRWLASGPRREYQTVRLDRVASSILTRWSPVEVQCPSCAFTLKHIKPVSGERDLLALQSPQIAIRIVSTRRARNVRGLPPSRLVSFPIETMVRCPKPALLPRRAPLLP